MPTQPSVVKGWKVGDPVNNLTKKGGIPKWDTIRQRYWKNEAHFHPEKYSVESLAKIKKGRAPQEFFEGRLRSMELHHVPPQEAEDYLMYNELLH